jgi:hypothetical protein
MLVLLVSLSALPALSVGPSASSEPTAPVSERPGEMSAARLPKYTARTEEAV